MLRYLYSVFMWLAQPLLKRKLTRRGTAEPGYLEAMGERFGDYAASPLPSHTGYLWLHAVSLGETRAAAPLIARLRTDNPGMHLLLTHGTATGRTEGARLLLPGDAQVWQPWDTPGNVQAFLHRFRPRIGILMETEIWPNLVVACANAGVPLVLANARLSDKSLKAALRLAWLAKPAYQALAAVWAQTESDAQRLRQLGAPVQGVFGNLKFDAEPGPERLARGRQWAQTWRAATHRPVVIFASSREDEEQLLIDALRQNEVVSLVDSAQAAIKYVAPVQWLIVPRHPQRFDEVAELLTRQGFTVSRRSTWPDGPPADDDTGGTTVWLGDSLGEMALYYGLADAALLGGSFAPLGGQNLIEAAACGCPVVMGPHTFNFLEAAELALEAGAAKRVASMAQAVVEVTALVGDRAVQDRMAAQSLAFAQAHRGAVAKTAAAALALLQ